MRLFEIEKVRPPSWKSGGIPFYVENGNIWVCLVTSTDPVYNGPDPCILKGRADFNETPKQGALREVYEETGIAPNEYEQVFHIATENVEGLTRSYDFHIFGLQCKQKVNIRGSSEGTPKWYTSEEALHVIRKIHKPFLERLLRNPSAKLRVL